jgi:hypothetical protein
MNAIFALLAVFSSPLLIGPTTVEPPHTPVQQQESVLPGEEVVYFDAPLFPGDVIYMR